MRDDEIMMWCQRNIDAHSKTNWNENYDNEHELCRCVQTEQRWFLMTSFRTYFENSHFVPTKLHVDFDQETIDNVI
jgi:hypothetical protein